MWTIEHKVATAIQGQFEWLYLESFNSEEDAEKALAEHTSSEGESEWFRLVPSKMTYDPMYNAAYCHACGDQMHSGAYDWADAEYNSRLENYTIQEFKDKIIATYPTSKNIKKFGFTKWTCGCCEKPFMGV